MSKVYDLVEAIQEAANEHYEQSGTPPKSLTISPVSYRRLLEIIASENAIGNLIIACFPATSLETAFGRLAVMIDEMMADSEVAVA